MKAKQQLDPHMSGLDEVGNYGGNIYAGLYDYYCKDFNPLSNITEKEMAREIAGRIGRVMAFLNEALNDVA